MFDSVIRAAFARVAPVFRPFRLSLRDSLNIPLTATSATHRRFGSERLTTYFTPCCRQDTYYTLLPRAHSYYCTPFPIAAFFCRFIATSHLCPTTCYLRYILLCLPIPAFFPLAIPHRLSFDFSVMAVLLSFTKFMVPCWTPAVVPYKLFPTVVQRKLPLDTRLFCCAAAAYMQLLHTTRWLVKQHRRSRLRFVGTNAVHASCSSFAVRGGFEHAFERYPRGGCAIYGAPDRLSDIPGWWYLFGALLFWGAVGAGLAVVRPRTLCGTTYTTYHAWFTFSSLSAVHCSWTSRYHRGFGSPAGHPTRLNNGSVTTAVPATHALARSRCALLPFTLQLTLCHSHYCLHSTLSLPHPTPIHRSTLALVPRWPHTWYLFYPYCLYSATRPHTFHVLPTTFHCPCIVCTLHYQYVTCPTYLAADPFTFTLPSWPPPHTPLRLGCCLYYLYAILVCCWCCCCSLLRDTCTFYLALPTRADTFVMTRSTYAPHILPVDLPVSAAPPVPSYIWLFSHLRLLLQPTFSVAGVTTAVTVSG